MANFGSISFHNPRASGVLLNQLGSGTLDHIGFFGPQGVSSAIQVGQYNDSTIFVDSGGAVVPHIGSESGAVINNKYVTDTTVQISGFAAQLLSLTNVFNADNLSTEPNFINQSSGSLLVRYFASGVSDVHTYNVNIFAYDATGSFADAPPDVTVRAYEINASGQWFNSAQTEVWKTIHGQSDAYFFTNHSPSNGWRAANEHLWVAGISVRANSVGVLDDWNLAFSMQFA